MLHPYTCCAFPSGLAAGLSQKRLCSAGDAVLLSQEAVLVEQLGPAALCRTLKVTLGCRQGRRRRKEAQMGRRAPREEWGLAVSRWRNGTPPVSCSKS